MREVWRAFGRLLIVFLPLLAVMLVVPVTANADVVPVTCTSWYPDTDPGAGVGQGCDAWAPSEAPQPVRYCDDNGPPQWTFTPPAQPAVCSAWRYEGMTFDQPAPTTTPPTTPPVAAEVVVTDGQFTILAGAASVLVFFSAAAFVASFRRR